MAKSSRLRRRLEYLRGLAEKRGALKVRKAFIVLRPDEDIPDVDYRVKGYSVVSPEDWPQTGDIVDIDFDSEEDVEEYAYLNPPSKDKSGLHMKQLMEDDLELFRELCQWEPDEVIELDPAPTTSREVVPAPTHQEAPGEAELAELVVDDMDPAVEPVLDDPEVFPQEDIGEDGVYGDQRRYQTIEQGDEPSVTRWGERGWEPWRG